MGFPCRVNMNNNDFKATVNVEELFLSMPVDRQNDFLIRMLKLRQINEKVKIVRKSLLDNEIHELLGDKK